MNDKQNSETSTLCLNFTSNPSDRNILNFHTVTEFPRRWYCIARSLSSDSLVLIHKMMILLMLLLLSIVRNCIEWQPSYGWWKWRLPLSWNYSKTSSKKPDWWPRFIFTSHSVKTTKKCCHPDFMWKHYWYIFWQGCNCLKRILQIHQT